MERLERIEFSQIIEELMSTYNDLGECCANCPYADQCENRELYYHCDVWETGQGEDL